TTGASPSQRLLARLTDPLSPNLDEIVARIEPLATGRLYADPGLTVPLDFADVVPQIAPTTGVVVISDAGAARRTFRIGRLLDTVAMLKAVRGGSGTVWLNPMPRDSWPETTASSIARHVPMFGLDRDGMQRSVDVLRGRLEWVEHPL